MTNTSSNAKTGAVPPANPNPPVRSPTGAPSVQSMPPTNRPGARPAWRPPQAPIPPKPPGATGAKQDTLQSLSSKPAMPGNQPPRPQPPVTRQTPAPGSVKPVQRVVKASDLTAEDFFKRLHWLETAYQHQRAYIKDLSGRLQRTGTAVPNMPHLEPLKSAAGDIDPNVG